MLAQKTSGAVRADLPFTLRAENALVSYARYLGKLFYPANLSIFYPHPRHWPMGWVVASALLVVIVSTFRRNSGTQTPLPGNRLVLVFGNPGACHWPGAGGSAIHC